MIAKTDREVTLELASNDATRAQYPWEFLARIRYSLAGATLTVETRIENRGGEPMPFALGFHPYFHVPDAEKSRARIDTDATRGFDNVTKTIPPSPGHSDGVFASESTAGESELAESALGPESGTALSGAASADIAPPSNDAQDHPAPTERVATPTTSDRRSRINGRRVTPRVGDANVDPRADVGDSPWW